MRDINRISITCLQLAKIWKKCPDMRLGQLFNNFQKTIGNDGFYLEDDEFIDKLNICVDLWLKGE